MSNLGLSPTVGATMHLRCEAQRCPLSVIYFLISNKQEHLPCVLHKVTVTIKRDVM